MGEDEATSSGSDDIVMSPPDENQHKQLMLEQVPDIDYSVADEEDMQLMLYTNPSNSIGKFYYLIVFFCFKLTYFHVISDSRRSS